MTVRRSRFLAQAARAETPGAARDFVESIRARWPDATHNCWAYVAGPPGSTARIGASDDGEPRGTAGRPMLTVLLHSGVGEICCVVTRWFGGVKLGTGGLVRAYQESVSACLADLPLAPKVLPLRLSLRLDYADSDRARRLLARHGARVLAEDYGASVLLTVELPDPAARAFQEDLAEATGGRALVSPLPDEADAASPGLFPDACP